MRAVSTVVVAAAVVAALYFGREFLIPLALAVLISFALAPLVMRLRRIGLPRIPAVLACVVVVTLVVGAFAVVVATQLLALAESFPTYQVNLAEKIRSLRDAAPSGGSLERATEAIQDLGREIDQATRQPETVARADLDGRVDVTRPVPVEIREPPPTAIQTLTGVVGPLVEPLITTGLIVVFVIFMLIERTELRDRLIRLIDAQDLSRASKAVDDAAHRVSRYLLMQLLIAVAHGLPYGLGLWAIGVPNALLWGVLATVLRFIPYVGPIASAVFPLLLALAVDPGWTMVWQTALLILVLELFTSNVLEPWLYGSTTGLSPVAVLAAAVFWTSLWGPIGLLLSVPLTVCVVVLGRHVPGLAVLELLLGDRPALGTADRVYQRLLAGDRFEALALAGRHESEAGFERLADEVLLPALRLAEHDRERHELDPAGQERIAALVEEIGAELVDADPHAFSAPTADDTPPRPRLLCVGGRHALDVAAAGVGARALELAGIDVKVVPASALRPVGVAAPAAERPLLLVLAFLSEPPPELRRRLERRARQRLGAALPLVSWQWGGARAAPRADEADAVTGPVAALVEAVRARLGVAPPAAPEAAEPEPAPAVALRTTPRPSPAG